MGNAVPGMPDMRLGEIKELVETMFTTFTPLYALGYGEALIAEEKAMRSGGGRVIPYRLLTMPLPSEPLASGFVMKLGEVRKNWKKRFMVVLNEADNYEARLFENEVEAPFDRKKVKGTGIINFASRRVSRLRASDDDDVKVFESLKRPKESHILRIAPYWKWDQRRTWFIELENEEQLSSWEDALRFAAWRARAPLNPDPVKRAAFESAYRQTRRELRVWGYYSCCATEEEMLAFLANDAVEDTIMPSVYSAIKSGRAERIIRDKVRETVNNTVGASVRAGWIAASKAIDTAEPSVRDAVAKAVGPILDAVALVENKIADSATGVIRPAVESSLSPVLEPILKLLFSPLANAHAKAVEVVRESLIATCAAEGGATSEKGLKYLSRVERNARYQRSVFYEPCRALRDDRGDWGEAARAELAARAPGLSEWRMDNIMREGLALVCKNAVFTFKRLITDGLPGASSPLTPEAAMADTLGRMVVDCKIAAIEDMHSIFMSVLYPLVLKAAKAGLDPVMEPISSSIPEVAKAFINPTTMVEDLLQRILADAVLAGINKPARAVLDERMGALDGIDMAVVAKYESDEAAAAAAAIKAAEAAEAAASKAKAAGDKAAEAATEAVEASDSAAAAAASSEAAKPAEGNGAAAAAAGASSDSA
ncbi:hypothetical protein FNF31_00440 [Cafeteria roenbergensis]|uniref:PH domain-containing protein n=1 Tax=Cafeteria roenbergensis TaxID=33653 RepID=A0A5A8DXQ3_CAFRO|nr:hypothetical protein FNF31_00440 [Cafeteria roenbergensis]KAA0171157.1 hypothetical protein FNF28_00924 [Cafeteria roenbergensis]